MEVIKLHQYTMAFDVGGTFIKAAVLNKRGEIIPNSFAIFPSRSKDKAENIIDNLLTIIKQQKNMMLDKDFQILGIGYAFPGPFDYEKGVSYIKGVDKFEALYGMNVRQELMRRLKQEPSFQSKISDGFKIVFKNDAELFALGEELIRKQEDASRTIYLTMGTGLGSAFMENRKTVSSKYNIPKNGWIYDQPYKHSIVDDYISKRGILKIAEELGITIKDNDVKLLAEMARNNHQKAKEVFNTFGQNLGEVLSTYINSFQPEAIVIGGQIAKSKDLFIDKLYEEIEDKSIVIHSVNDTSRSIFLGVAI